MYKNFNIIDCTIRDGGYYNNWNFSKKFANEYLKVLSKLGIDYVEIGFKKIINLKDFGQFSKSEYKYIKKLNIPNNLKICVMADLSDFKNYEYYKKINKSGAQPMTYDEEWAVIEEEYDAKHPKKSQTIPLPTLSSLSLSDVLIIRNWIDYARGIGDSSVFLLDHHDVGSQEMYEIAKTRLEKYPWLQSVG